MDTTAVDSVTPAETPSRLRTRGLGIQFDRIRRHVWLVAAFVILAAIAAGAAAASSSSTFTGQAVLSVASKTRSPIDDAALAQGYVMFFNESNYRRELAQRAKVDSAVDEIGAQTAGLSPVFYITASSTSRAAAQAGAAALAKSFADEVNARLAGQRDAQIVAMTKAFRSTYQDRTDPDALAAQTQLQQQIDTMNADTTNQVTVLQDSAGVTEEGSGILQTAAILLAGGLLLGCAAAIAVSINSRRLDTDYDVVEKLGIEPMEVLPDSSDTASAAGSAVRIQHVLNNVVRGQKRPAALTVASAADGGSAGDLAVRIAEQRAAQGVKTVLVDANLRRAGADTRAGLAELLSADPPELDDVAETRSETLTVIAPGNHSGDPYALFDRDAFSRLIGRLHERADFVVVAAPALAASGEAQMIGDVTGDVLLVLDQGTRIEDAREALRVLDQVDATLVGTVLVERERGRRR